MRLAATLALGATLGALLRYQLSLWAAARFGPRFPMGTLLVNMVGSLLLGFVLALPALNARTRLAVATGFCGSLTTFSTFSYETVALFERGNVSAALLNVVVSVLAGLLCVILGAALARAVA